MIFSGFLEADECTPFVGPNSAVVKIDWRCVRFSSTLVTRLIHMIKPLMTSKLQSSIFLIGILL